MSMTESPDAGTLRRVSAVAGSEQRDALRDAIDADEALTLTAISSRFANLVVDPGFPGDVVVLAEEPGRTMLAHARTVVAAGALVVVHADVDTTLRRALEGLGAATVPLGEPAEAVAEQVAAVRRPTRRRTTSWTDEPAERRPRLSPGERRALTHYVQGLTTVQVAAEMGVGYETAKTFLRRVRAKYAAVDRPAGRRAELINRAEEDGLL